MPNKTPKTHLSASEYLWLQQEKRRLFDLDMQIARLENRQNRQSAWIALLLLTVIVLAAGLVFVLMV